MQLPLLLRDVRLGVIAMVPNLLPILAVMGIMGIFGIPIDMNNMLVASIAIGIAVDDTIHFLHQFRVHFADSGDVEAAIDHAFGHAGRAMTLTTLILVGGFLVMFAGAMHSTVIFGLLVTLAMLFALVFDVVFSPALLRLAYRSKTAPTAPEGAHSASPA